MIYGLIPVGGKGTRLNLPFSKEMLPQKHYNYYNPVINHTVDKMLLAGAELIYMVHGPDYKQDIVQFYINDPRIVHIAQPIPSFSGVLYDFKDWTKPKPDDKILFGLPDSVYNTNPFIEMLNIDGIVCGLFKSDDATKVDRLSTVDRNKFQVKAEKTPLNTEWFWGILKFDGSNLLNMVIDDTEIGYLLNREKKTYIYGESYIDLGTWPGYNRYISSSDNFGKDKSKKW